MKKIISILFVLSFAIIFSSASANAQNVGRVDVKIPFDFGFGARAYAAGSYRLRITDHLSGSAVISLQDEAGNELESIFSLRAIRSIPGDPSVAFDESNGLKSIETVVLNDTAYMLRVSHLQPTTTVRVQPRSQKSKTPKTS